MANAPFFTTDSFIIMTDVTNAVTPIFTAGAVVVLKNISFASAASVDVTATLLINGRHFAQFVVPGRSGFTDTNDTSMVNNRYEIFSENILPGVFSTSGQGYLGLQSGDIVSVHVQTALDGNTFNASVIGSNT